MIENVISYMLILKLLESILPKLQLVVVTMLFLHN